MEADRNDVKESPSSISSGTISAVQAPETAETLVAYGGLVCARLAGFIWRALLYELML